MGIVSKIKKQCATPLFFAALLFFSACAGPDYMPEYFPSKAPADEGGAPEAAPSEGTIPAGSCTVSFESRLCVTIKGEGILVGTEGEEPLCAELDPIPIEVSGGVNLILRGNTFPDIPFEGHGLPAPIVINGRGKTDGKENIGSGKVDQNGEITIEGFSFFINALGMVGELPGLTLTTGRPDELEGLPDIEGVPLKDDGTVKLVIGTVIGHLFPAADEKLLGASLQAAFEGTISPPIGECKGEGAKPQATFVTKLVPDEKGGQTEAILPGQTRMEAGRVFIAQSPHDIGPAFESSAKFKIINASAKPISIDIPQVIGPFSIDAMQNGLLKQSLPPKTPLIIKVTFRPTGANTKGEGEAVETISIGPDVYQLVGEAIKPSGRISMDIVDDSGAAEPAKDNLKIGEVSVTTAGRREFFSCKKIVCGGVEKLTQCMPCVDVLVNVCQLLNVDRLGNPTGVVDDKCRPLGKGEKDSAAIGLGFMPVKRTVVIKNRGVKPLTISAIEIQEVKGSRSIRQFRVVPELPLPVTMEPFNISGRTFKITVLYEPDDLIGFDGSEAVVGHPVKDKAFLRIVTGDSGVSMELAGTTSVKEVPALQVYFRSASGTKELLDGSEFAFRGLTAKTTDLSVPVFIKLSDSAAKPVRITKLGISSGAGFEWLDTKEKINSKPEGSRCEIPQFDAEGNQVGRITDLNPVSLLPNGFDLRPGAYTPETMPLFGCVNFHMGDGGGRQYRGVLTISTLELGADGMPARNADGSLKQTDFNINLLAVINPIKGRIVFRLTQTMAAIMNPQFPGVSASSGKKDMDYQIADGLAKESDRFIMPGALILDPFDEETIKDEKGEVVSAAGDGVTAVYRRIDTHPTDTVYGGLLPDYTSLTFDSTAPEGERGIFFDYPFVPEGTKLAGLRIYTAALSYPGPLASPAERPENVSLCQVVDPCSEEGQRMMGEGPSDTTKRGVCTFFYASAGDWNGSKSLRRPDEIEGGELQNLCRVISKSQKLKDVSGYYELNGNLVFPDVGLRLWGPTYFNNPAGPLGPVQPMDAVFHIAFTTGVLKPGAGGGSYDVIPDKRVNTGKLEHKINLNDAALETPRLCDNSVKNRLMRGEYYSSWKYLAPLLVKDEEGAVPAGCPEAGNNFTGGSAFLKGRPLDQETGVATFVGTAKFASDDNLTFAFKDIMFFMVLNGWFCDPAGQEDQFEGRRCFDNVFNERDALSTISIVE